MRHLNRLAQDAAHIYAPVMTLTTCEEFKEGDERWFERVTRADVGAYSLYDFLTYYEEGVSRYFVVMDKLRDSQGTGRTPLIGMTPPGLERLMSHKRIEPIPFSAIFLQPADQDEFQTSLMREYGFEPEHAAEETERAVRLSTIPPAPAEHPSSIIPVPICGTADDAHRIDNVLRSLVSP